MDKEKITSLRDEASRVEESAKLTAQTQFEYAKTWRSVDRWLGGLAASFAAAAAAGGLSEIFSARWAGLIALVAAALGAVATTLGAPKTKEQAHASANALLALQQNARIFINIDLERLDEDEAREQLRALVARLQDLNSTTELSSRRSWVKGKRNVESGEQAYEADQ